MFAHKQFTYSVITAATPLLLISQMSTLHFLNYWRTRILGDCEPTVLNLEAGRGYALPIGAPYLFCDRYILKTIPNSPCAYECGLSTYRF